MRNGLTLIEVLISVAIGVLLLAMITGALMAVRRTIDHNKVLLKLHNDAATVNRILQTNASNALPGAKWELDADPGPDGVWDSGDEILTLTWMTTLTDPNQVTYGFDNNPKNDLIWCRLRWERGDGDTPSILSYAQNSGFRYRRAAGKPIHAEALPRRDRRRDLDDNDLRYIPGLDPATWADIGMPGDSQDLDSRLQPIHSPVVTVEDLSIAWVDRAGYEVRATVDGISQTNPSGNPEALAGGTWDNSRHVAVDGVFLDAREHTAPGASRSVAASRPVLLRLSFTLVEYQARALGSQDPTTLEYEISIPIGQEMGRP